MSGKRVKRQVARRRWTSVPRVDAVVGEGTRVGAREEGDARAEANAWPDVAEYHSAGLEVWYGRK